MVDRIPAKLLFNRTIYCWTIVLPNGISEENILRLSVENKFDHDKK